MQFIKLASVLFNEGITRSNPKLIYLENFFRKLEEHTTLNGDNIVIHSLLK